MRPCKWRRATAPRPPPSSARSRRRRTGTRSRRPRRRRSGRATRRRSSRSASPPSPSAPPATGSACRSASAWPPLPGAPSSSAKKYSLLHLTQVDENVEGLRGRGELLRRQLNVLPDEVLRRAHGRVAAGRAEDVVVDGHVQVTCVDINQRSAPAPRTRESYAPPSAPST